MFPAYRDFAQVKNEIEKQSELSSKIGRSFLFDYKKKQFVIMDGNVVEPSELEAIKQWLELLLRTALDKFIIYRGRAFGTTMENYIGIKSLPNGFIESELERELAEAIGLCGAIERINSISTTRARNAFKIDLSVELKNKQLLEVSINDW